MKADENDGWKRYLPLLIIGGVLLAAVVGATLLLRSADSRSGQQNTNSPQDLWARAAPGAEPAHTHGEANAPVSLEEFGDYQCPPCANVHPILKRIEKDYGGRVRIVFRNFPLEGTHKNAFLAARAAEAAGMQGKFWEMHDMLYEHQAEWAEQPLPRPTFVQYAGRIGLDLARFEADMNRTEVGARVGADMKRGVSLGVRSTPTIFLNGRELPPERSLVEDKLRAEIDAALAGKGR
jgi:protein-disulfide isomerase